jgi:hypothetical protein
MRKIIFLRTDLTKIGCTLFIYILSFSRYPPPLPLKNETLPVRVVCSQSFSITSVSHI